jgi:hypothetical protein
MYVRSSIAETLKTIKQKHDESLQDYMKHFCNARSTKPYIQDIKVINAFRDGVSDINTMEEITMKSLKRWSICLQLLTSTLRPLRPVPSSMNHITRGCQERRSRTIRRSILQTVGIMETTEIMKITNNNPHSRRRRGHSAALMMQRSGVSFIAPQDMICRSARLFWIAR